MSIGKRIGAGFGLAVVGLIFLGSLALFSTWKLIATSSRVALTHQILEKLEDLLSLMKDAETGQRGYLITGQPSYLKPYQDAISEIGRTMNALKSLTADEPSQQRRLEAIKPLYEAKLQELKETIDTRARQGPEAAFELVRTDRGKAAMDQFRQVVQACNNEERDQLKQRDAERETMVRITLYGIGIGTLLAVLVLLVGGLGISRSISRSIREAVSRVTRAGADLLASTQQQASSVQEQAAAVAETVTTVDQVTQTAAQTADRAKGVGGTVQHSLDIGQEGRKAVEDSIAALETLREQVESTAENILMLAEQAQAIGEIIATVNDIAEQTNLLALNAAIEASRAGEYGHGFAVVASEVKVLADQSKKATIQVRQILGEIQKATNTAVLSTEDVTKGVSAAATVVSQAGETIETLADTLEKAAQASAQIAASAGQQATGMTQINQAMKSLDEAARQNLAATRQIEQAAQDLNAVGTQLARLTGGQTGTTPWTRRNSSRS